MDAPFLSALAAARPGERWVVRHRLADGSATDVVGWIEGAAPAGAITVVTGSPLPNGTPAPARTVPLDTVVAARRVPAAPGGPDPRRIPAETLQRIALPGWLGEHEPLGEWTLRSAGGFTGRANSCLAVGDPGVGYPEAAERIRRYSADHGIAPWAQVVTGSPADLGLVELGWVPVYVPTAVYVIRLAELLDRTLPDPQIEVTEDLSDEWLAGYRESRPNDADPRVLRLILDGQPPRAFAAAADRSGLFALGRGHVEGGWLGLAAIWTRPDRRRSGWGTRILFALGHWAARAGARYAYLQVAEENIGAVRTYERLGFSRHHGYRYLVSPSDRLPEPPISPYISTQSYEPRGN
jgi:N-acetylglutamate synthase